MSDQVQTVKGNCNPKRYLNTDSSKINCWYCLYTCTGILKKSELWQHSDPGWPKEEKKGKEKRKEKG